MPKESNPLQRTSVQLMIFVAAVALFANSAVDRTDDGLPWEVTLAGFCVFAVVFSAIYAKKTEVALSIVRCARIDNIVLRSLRSHSFVLAPRSIIGLAVPTYFVHNSEVPCTNWELGSQFPLATDKSGFLEGVWRNEPNASKFDKFLPMGLSTFQFSLFNPAIALTSNTSEIYHSGLKLSDPVTGERTHDYLLLSSPRKVKAKTVGIMVLARVPVRFELWPKEVEDYSFDLQTASNVVAPPTLVGELVKLDKGPAMESIKSKHYLRPFILDVYQVDFNFG